MKNLVLFALAVQCVLSVGVLRAQDPCPPPRIVFNNNSSNIFSEQQEMYLGEVMAETLDKNFSVLADQAATAYLSQIGERLIKHLPPTGIKFQFFVIDSPELNAFNVAGGRVYVTRKMIAFVENEDELAGILGHELGHGIVRHHSSDVSRLFKEVLGVERVGDRQDVFDKFNQFLDRQRTKRVRQSRGHEGDQQLEADRIGLFAMMAAGYDPNAYASAWERMTDAKRTSGGLSDLFGASKPEEKRLREMLKAIGSRPAGCLDRPPATAAAAFSKWQTRVVSIVRVSHREKFRGLVSRGTLKPYLRGSIKHFQFSPDGKYILAQDASGINILTREPFQFYFRLNVENAKPAMFSPDSKQLVFQTYGLRVESWDLATQSPSIMREVYVRGDCWQSALSPDGKTLVCYSTRGALDLINVETNEKIFTREKFYLPSVFEFIGWQYRLSESDQKEISAIEMEFSPDSKYFLGGRVFRYETGGFLGTGPFIFSWGVDASQDAFIAYDLSERKELKLPDSLRNIVSSPFAFYSKDMIIGQHRKDPEKSGLFTFPGGERVEKFFLNAASYEKPHKGEYILVRPTRSNPVGVYSIPQKKFLLGNKTTALDGYGDVFVSEGKDGIVDLVRVVDKTVEELGSVGLPRNDLGDIRTVSVSGALDRLAISESARGGVWDLKTGDIKVYIRGFRGSFIDSNGQVFADFPAYEKEPRMMAQLDSNSGVGTQLKPVAGLSTRQHGKFLVRVKTKVEEEAEKNKPADKEKERAGAPAPDGEEKKRPNITLAYGSILDVDYGDFALRGATLEVSDAVTRTVLWSKPYENEVPKYHVDDRAGTMALYWRVTSKSAKDIIRNNATLAVKVKAMGEKQGDYLVQVIDVNTGASKGEILIETGEGSFTVEKVFAAGDWVSVIDSQNRILFYSLATGELRSRVFGERALINTAHSIAVVENMNGVLSVVDLNTGRRLDDLRFPSPIAHTTFNSEENQLFVLTANQQYYVFNVATLRSS